mmetsp:Transcript_71822/g.208012  ORF Transcript_71822/g.208012 Transcript_71822/m.208012 type:complete len:108 (+) Transcript_71822:1-324(+)
MAVFLRSLMNRAPSIRPMCSKALQHPFFSSSALSSTSLRPLFNQARRCGAFGSPDGKSHKPTVVDVHLRALQEKHHPGVSSREKTFALLSEQSTTDTGESMYVSERP